MTSVDRLHFLLPDQVTCLRDEGLLKTLTLTTKIQLSNLCCHSHSLSIFPLSLSPLAVSRLAVSLPCSPSPILCSFASLAQKLNLPPKLRK
eukprot:771326-Amorphochlora_amoeboformis.AAC.1